MWASANLTVRLFALVAIAVLPALAVEVYDEIETQKMRAHESEEQALRLVRLVAGELSQTVEGARQLLTALGQTPFVQAGEAKACSAFFIDLAQAYTQYTLLASSRLDGGLICASEEPVDLNNFLKSVLHVSTFTVGGYTITGDAKRKIVPIVQPYLGSDRKIAGIVAAGLSVDWLNNSVAHQPLPPRSTISVIDHTGTIVARYPETERFVGQKVSGDSHTVLLSGKEGVRENIGFDGVPRMYSYAPVPGTQTGLVVSIGLEKREILKGAESANWRGVLTIAGSAVLAFLLAGLGARAFLHRPVQALLETVEQWRKGDLHARVNLQSNRSELGRLGSAFNAMAEAVGDREDELEQRVRNRTSELEQAMEAQRATEAALHQAQKMETIGRLTGGIAHDFNNLLAAIAGNLELAVDAFEKGNAARPRLDAALTSATRGATMTQRLLAFARRQHLLPEVVDIANFVLELKDVLQRLVRSDIEVKTVLPANTWSVKVDPNQLEAAILNLAINARDAMPGGGMLRLETKNVLLKGHQTSDHPPDDFVALSVQDTGTGIQPEHLESVFEPFFTTKEVGEGSGLGLSMVQGFVRQSSGWVSIESVVGEGTTITLHFPRAYEDTGKTNDVAEKEMPVGEGQILLVDDDDEVCDVVASMLISLGYSVTTAHDAEQALRLFDDTENIDILVTDLVMPGGTNGIELARAVRQRHPNLPLVLITGYSATLSHDEPIRGAVVLNKPFLRQSLAEAVQRAVQASKLLVPGLDAVDPYDVLDATA